MRRLVVPAIGALCGGVLSYIVFTALLGSPSRVVSVRELDGIALKSDRLELLFSLKNQTRSCPTIVDRQMWRWTVVDGKRIPYIVPLPSVSSPITPASVDTVILAIQTPPGLTTGDWFYSSRSTFSCSWLGWLSGVTQIKSPDVPIKILSEDK